MASSSSDIEAAVSSELAVRGLTGDLPVADADAAPCGNVLSHHGCERLQVLLNGLAVMFPEKETLATWIIIFENTILNNPEMEDIVIRRWNKEMTEDADGNPRVPNLYVKTRERDIEFLLNSKVWVLDEIDVRSMYYDPDIEDADREAICQHLDKINSCAEALSAVPLDMMQCIMSSLSKLDHTQPITVETTFALLQNMIGCKPEDLAHNTDAMDRLVGWSRHLIDGLHSGGLEALQRIAGETSAAAGTGLPDMSAIAAMMQSELLGCHDILSTSTDAIDESQLSNLSSMFFGGAKP